MSTPRRDRRSPALRRGRSPLFASKALAAVVAVAVCGDCLRASDGAGVGVAPVTAAASGGTSTPGMSPAASAPKARPAGSRRVVREGSFLTNRRGRLVQEGRDWLFEFDRDARGVAEPTMVVQPGQRLTEMERLLESRVEALTFVISGEVFVYRGRNYLLPLFFSVARSAGADPAPAAEGTPKTEPGGAPAPEPSNPSNPSPEELLRGVEKASAPDRESARERALGATLGAESAPTPGLRREGEFLNLRKARVARTPGGQWRATLDNDPPAIAGAAPSPSDAPMTLLGCQTLARLETLAERAPGGLTLSLSGHVFLYEGENYLLPTMFVVEYADVSDLRSGQ